MLQLNTLTAAVINELMNRGKPWREALRVFVAMIIILFFVASAALLTEGMTSDNVTNDSVANDGEVSYRSVTIQEGDSLWQLVTQTCPSIQPHILIERTLRYNNLKSTYLTAGQQIYIPYTQ